MARCGVGLPRCARKSGLIASVYAFAVHNETLSGIIPLLEAVMRCVLFLFFFAVPLWAQQQIVPDDFNDAQVRLFKNMTEAVSTPCCSNGIPVAYHDSGMAGWVRDKISAWIREGKDKKEISLLETTRREEMDEDDAKRKARKAARDDNGPLLEESDELADVGEPPEAAADDAEEDADEEEEDDDRPDLLLRESARIVGDMIELGIDERTLANQFSLLDKNQKSNSIN